MLDDSEKSSVSEKDELNKTYNVSDNTKLAMGNSIRIGIIPETTKIGMAAMEATRIGISSEARMAMFDFLENGIYYDATKVGLAAMEATRGISPEVRIEGLNFAKIGINPEVTKMGMAAKEAFRIGITPEATRIVTAAIEATRVGIIPEVKMALEAATSNQFKNLVVPKETFEKAYPSLNIDNQNVKSILSGISPSKFKIENEVLEKGEIDSFFVMNDTSDKIPVKSMVSTVSSTELLNSITKEEALSFYNYLAKFPMLGLEHNVGKKIFDELNNIKIRTVHNNTLLFRARPRDSEKREIPYTTEEMFSAPYGVTGIGRFNYSGHGELYTCDNKDVAIKECLKNSNISVDIMKLELIKTVDLIDLTEKDTPLVQFCSFSVNTSSGLEYLVPTFIAQCAKRKGITGIVFNSSQDSNALNYVFFDYLRGWFKASLVGTNVR
ncbi:RES family NAD+ phosphorylase [Paenibacillus silagei]|uniref:RES domain-containing protein n=1 Tax=Paenibacillus silagei TaxID=1670801 RepID=A0ABS4NXN4_9BACL|nr:RES family NAD+ phosphorylase [Paenibacillus silagei]MBP2114811.1 hypothetical protein [Paenibacillus silagei]